MPVRGKSLLVVWSFHWFAGGLWSCYWVGPQDTTSHSMTPIAPSTASYSVAARPYSSWSYFSSSWVQPFSWLLLHAPCWRRSFLDCEITQTACYSRAQPHTSTAVSSSECDDLYWHFLGHLVAVLWSATGCRTLKIMGERTFERQAPCGCQILATHWSWGFRYGSSKSLVSKIMLVGHHFQFLILAYSLLFESWVSSLNFSWSF